MLSTGRPYSIFRPWAARDCLDQGLSHSDKRPERGPRGNRLRKVRGQARRGDGEGHQDDTVSTTTDSRLQDVPPAEDSILQDVPPHLHSPVAGLTACCDRLRPPYLPPYHDVPPVYPAYPPPADPVLESLLLEEYVRVLREETAEKVLSARRQRPKKYRCPHCQVGFSNNGQLKGHVRIHTGERPFKCDVSECGKTFTRNEELTRHKRIHSGVRPYGCGTCGKRFGRRDHLKKHARTHLAATPVFVPMYHLPYLYHY